MKKIPKIIRICKVCGKEFEIDKWKLKWKKALYCSYSCSNKATASKRNGTFKVGESPALHKKNCRCPRCNGFGVNHNFGKGHVPWNKGIIWLEMRGINNPHWKGGQYDRNRKIDMGRREYRSWRKSVLERDNYNCVLCGATNDLHVDHIKSYHLYPELRYDISNGRVLCQACHKKTDNYGRKIYNNKIGVSNG